MRLLRLLHLYAGLALALPLFALAVTGGVLVYKQQLWRAAHPELRAAAPALTAQEHAAAFDAIGAGASREIALIKVPRGDMPVYHVYFDGGQAFVAPRTHEVVEQWQWQETALGVVSELHTHLLAGKAGKTVAGFVAVAAVLMIVSGAILWWPLRRKFHPRSFWPRRTSRLLLLRLHRDLGVAAGLLIALFALTGAGVVFSGQASALLNAALSERPPDRARPQVPAPGEPGMAGREVVSAALTAMPAGELTAYYPPAAGDAVHYFRFRNPGEVHPNGRSRVYVDDASARVLAVAIAGTQPAGERASYWLYPLHAAAIGGVTYEILAVVAAAALAVVSLTGPLAWLRTLRRTQHAGRRKTGRRQQRRAAAQDRHAGAAPRETGPV